MRSVVIILLLAFTVQPTLAQESEQKPDAVVSESGATLAPHKFERTETRRADGSYETEELKAMLDPFGPAGLVYLMLIVALMGAAVHIMAQARKVEYRKALDAYAAERAAKLALVKAATPEEESLLV